MKNNEKVRSNLGRGKLRKGKRGTNKKKGRRNGK